MSNSKVSLPLIERGKKNADTKEGPSSMALDLEAIRARRAKLEALTAERRLNGYNKKSTGVRSHSRSPGAPSSASKMRRQHTSEGNRPPTRHVKLEPLSDGGVAHNELDKQMSDDPLLKRKADDAAPGTPSDDQNKHDKRVSHDNEHKESDKENDKENDIEDKEVTHKKNVEGDHKDKETQDNKETETNKNKDEYNETDESDEDIDWTTNDEFMAALRQLKSLKEDELLKGATTARLHLSDASSPPIKEYIEAGALPLLVSLLDRHHNPTLQFQALWAVTNIASGSTDQTTAVIEAGALAPIHRLLGSPHEHIAEQAVWAVGNIAGDSAMTRNVVVNAGTIPILSRLIYRLRSVEGQRNLAWTFSNILRHKPYNISEDDWVDVFNALRHFLELEDLQTKIDAAWGIAFASDGDNVAIQRVVDLKILPEVSHMLYSHDPRVVTVAIRIVGNVVSGTDEQTDAVIRAGIVPRLVTLLSHDKEKVQKEVAWALSNIMAGNSVQIQAVINANAIPNLVELLNDEGTPFTVAKEVAWSLSNCTADGLPKQLEDLLHAGAFQSMLRYLQRCPQGTNVHHVILEGCNTIIKKTQHYEALRADLTLDEATEILSPYAYTYAIPAALELLQRLKDDVLTQGEAKSGAPPSQKTNEEEGQEHKYLTPLQEEDALSTDEDSTSS